MFNTNFIKKLDNQTLSTIHVAQIADLVERRGIRDAKLFDDCFTRVTPEDGTLADDVINFREYAAAALMEYHKIRAANRWKDEAATAPDTTDAE